MKTKYFIFFLFTSVISSCQPNQNEKNVNAVDLIGKYMVERSKQKDTSFYYYPWIDNYDYNSSLINNISVPNGYERIDYESSSFAAWLRHLPLKEDNTVYLFNNEQKYNQNAQYRVLDIDVGKKDLQQCADAVMRLRGEFLYTSKQYDKIHFKYTNGVNIQFQKWSNGFFPSLKGNNVVWVSSSNNKSYSSFKKYMNNIFMYAGTSSLEKEMVSVMLKDILPGDVFIKGGFPGHAVLVVDVAINNNTGDKIFMLAQSYMPAQNIHVLKNMNNEDSSPWYRLKDIEEVIETPEWTFYSNQLKRFR